MKTKNLTGAALDWAVAKCAVGVKHLRINGGAVFLKNCDDLIPCNFATDWGQAGPIIEREKIKVAPNLNGTWLGQIRHEKDHPRVAQKVLAGWTNQHGPTPLIAAMRCFVASKLGDDVNIPDELFPG